MGAPISRVSRVAEVLTTFCSVTLWLCVTYLAMFPSLGAWRPLRVLGVPCAESFRRDHT